MQFLTLTPLTLLLSASTVLAIDPIPQPFFCAIETFGACCITFNPPKSPFGKGCTSAIQILSNAARGVNEKRVFVNEFICEERGLINACCDPIDTAGTGSTVRCSAPIEVDIPV